MVTRQPPVPEPPAPPGSEGATDELKRLVHAKLLKGSDYRALQQMSDNQFAARIARLTADAIQERGDHVSQRARQQLETEILNEVIGYGPLQELLQDPTITEIMVNGPHQIVVERNGQLEFSSRSFTDDAHVRRIIERIVSPLGRRIDESTPMVDARLPDGSRVNAIIPPLSLEGPCLTIRKFPEDHLSPQDLVNFGTMSERISQFIQACVEAKLNIIVSGGTGTGKTTLLNVLSSFIPDRERIVTIEDAAELRLQQRHRVRLESRPANIEGQGQVTIRDLVRNALRMRPDRIIVGEVRGGEALDMLQAMNTGHDGSLSTLHSNSPRDTIARLETMVLMAGMELPLAAIREQIARALHLIIHLARFRDGSRRIVSISEVQRLEHHQVVLQDLFRFERTGLGPSGEVLGRFRAAGVRPLFMTVLEAEGTRLPAEVFAP